MDMFTNTDKVNCYECVFCRVVMAVFYDPSRQTLLGLGEVVSAIDEEIKKKS
jgi:hypothetical protein